MKDNRARLFQKPQYVPVQPEIKMRLVVKGEDKFSNFLISDSMKETPTAVDSLLSMMDALEVSLDRLERAFEEESTHAA